MFWLVSFNFLFFSYPYEKFFERSAAILNYVDTRDMWASIEENDLGGKLFFKKKNNQTNKHN